MRLPHLLLLPLLLAALPCLPVQAKAKPPAPKRTALIGIFEPSDDPANPPDLVVVAACIGGKRWAETEEAEGLVPKGDRLPLYTLTDGQVGEAAITGDGALDSATVVSYAAVGLRYPATATPLRGREKEYQNAVAGGPTGSGQPLLAVWHAPGSPAPKWVTARELSTENTVYRKVISDWLKAKGISQEVIATVVVGQILQADVNSDKRDEVILAFRTSNTPANEWRPRPTKSNFSYLVMRYVPHGSRKPRTVVLDDTTHVEKRVIGLCDLDSDGWAELVSEVGGLDIWGVQLHHWVGDRFNTVLGCGAGC